MVGLLPGRHFLYFCTGISLRILQPVINIIQISILYRTNRFISTGHNIQEGALLIRQLSAILSETTLVMRQETSFAGLMSGRLTWLSAVNSQSTKGCGYSFARRHSML